MPWPETADLAGDLDQFFLHLGNPDRSIDRFVERVRALQLRTGAWAVPVAPHQHGDPCPNCGTADGGGRVVAGPSAGDGFTRFRCGPAAADCGWTASHRPPPPIEAIATRLREVQRLVALLPPGPLGHTRGPALHVAIESALALAEYYRIQDEGAR